MVQRLRRSQVDDIDLIDDIEAIDHIEPRTKAEVARKRKRAEVSGMWMQAFRVSGLGQMGLIGLIRRGQRRGFGFIAKASEVTERLIKAE